MKFISSGSVHLIDGTKTSTDLSLWPAAIKIISEYIHFRKLVFIRSEHHTPSDLGQGGQNSTSKDRYSKNVYTCSPRKGQTVVHRIITCNSQNWTQTKCPETVDRNTAVLSYSRILYNKKNEWMNCAQYHGWFSPIYWSVKKAKQEYIKYDYIHIDFKARQIFGN